MNIRNILLGTLLGVFTLVVSAHTSERNADPVARHGGLAKRVGEYNIEVVAQKEQVFLYVHSRGNRALSTDGATASMRLMYDGGSTELSLLPSGSNQLTGDWQAPPVSRLNAVLNIKMYGHEPVKRLLVGVPLSVEIPE